MIAIVCNSDYPMVHTSIACLSLPTLHIAIDQNLIRRSMLYQYLIFYIPQLLYTQLLYIIIIFPSQTMIHLVGLQTLLQVTFDETLDCACWAEGILLQNDLIVDDKRVGLYKNFAWQFLLQNNIPNFTFPSRDRLG